MSAGLQWVPYTQELWAAQPLPPKNKYLLVRVLSEEQGVPDSLVVGYLRYAAGDPGSPVFTIPGRGGRVLSWCDCLPSDFSFPKET